MNITTLDISRDKAQAKYLEYRLTVRNNGTKRDANLMRAFKYAKDGHAMINLHDAMKRAGVNTKLEPRLAIIRADAKTVFLRMEPDGAARFSMDEWPTARASRRFINIPRDTFPRQDFKRLTTRVPIIPPAIRPPHALSNYHILFEVENWETVRHPDPALLRHVGGALYAVMATWDLTPLETSIIE